MSKSIQNVADPVKLLRETGLLFEINRRVLHPLGLALEIILDEDDPDKSRIGGIWDCRDDPEGIIFSPSSYESGHARFTKFMELEGDQRLKLREKLLGFVVQA